MPPTARQNQPQQSSAGLFAFAGLALWAVALITLGVTQREQPWSATVLVVGGLVGLSILLGMLIWTWAEALALATVITAGGLLALGLVLGEPLFIGLGVLALVLAGVLIPLALAITRVAERVAVGFMPPPAAPARRDGGADAELLQRIYETSMLSDNAKRVLFRERELELLVNAIEEDIDQGHYNAALTLCEAMSSLFGLREQAEGYRARIEHVRRERYEAEVDTALSNFETLLAAHDWSSVYQESARLKRLYPESHLVAGLDHRILQARDEYKRDLERRFLEAAQAEEIESAMALLRELDRYLDPDEAARLAEVAQGVIARHRDVLSSRFRTAVSDHQWATAAQVGDALIKAFPNSKMADEVRSMIDILRTRATEAAVSAEG